MKLIFLIHLHIRRYTSRCQVDNWPVFLNRNNEKKKVGINGDEDKERLFSLEIWSGV